MMSHLLSPDLRHYVSASFDRPHILASVVGFGGGLPAGARVLDAGAGQAPFRELFASRDFVYMTSDWEHSVHPDAHNSDITAPLDNLPLPDDSFDAIICTQVLEHVERPIAVLRELHRVLSPGGALLLTVPFVGELHEQPFDYFRYTSHGLRSMLAATGFETLEVTPLGGAFTVAAQLVRHWIAIIGGRGRVSRVCEAALWRLGSGLARLDRLDRRTVLTLGYAVRAVAADRGSAAP